MALRPRILFVEDEISIAEPFASQLRREGFDPQIARTAAEARARARGAPPDLVLLDLRLPDGDGRELARELRAASDVPIVMLTARGTEADRIVGLELGADDYVVKPFSGPEVVARIRAVLRRAGRGAAAPASGRLQVGALLVDLGARRAWLRRREVTLARKEFDLLARLARDAGRVVRREELMADVWDENWFGSTKTLDVHVRWLRGKLGEGWIETVRGVGFRLADPAGKG